MAKKSFKSGLGSLIQDSSIEFEENGISNGSGYTDTLRTKIEQLQNELKLWRTGKLTLDLFEKSLEDNHLAYNANTNSFSRID
jgi:hypothetical protein